MTTPPEDIDALFGLPPTPESAPSAAEAAAAAAAAAAEAAEAALAAEIAATIESGGFADDAPESRTNLRVEVAWPARMHLPDGAVIDLQVRNVSQGGVGLTSDEPVPAYTVVNFEMSVPPLDAGGAATPVRGTIKTTYSVAHGSKILCGSTWQAPPDGLELVKKWIERLRD